MDKIQALIFLRPGTAWRSDGITMEQIGGEPIAMPSEEEIQATMNSDAYRELRKAEYPPLADLADSLVHKENGDSAMYDSYIAACNAVKAKYPKPS